MYYTVFVSYGLKRVLNKYSDNFILIIQWQGLVYKIYIYKKTEIWNYLMRHKRIALCKIATSKTSGTFFLKYNTMNKINT